MTIMLTLAGTVRRITASQVRIALGILLFVIIAAAFVLSLHHKTILAAYPDPKNGPDCNDDFCDVVASGYGTGSTGNTLGPIPYNQTYNGNSNQQLGRIRSNDAGAQTYDQRCLQGSSLNGYDGNFFGIRGQTSSGGDDPTWWYQPPTNSQSLPGGRTPAASCKNNWNAGPGVAYRQYSNGNQSLYSDPANFLNPGKNYSFSTADIPGSLPAGWADNSPANYTYVTNHPNQHWKSPVNLRAASGAAGTFSTLVITCGGCGTPSVALEGTTFIYRVRFQLDPAILAKYNLDSAVLRTYAGSWSKGWIDSMGGASDAGGTSTSPCGYNGVCLGTDGDAGYTLESGWANGGDYTQYFRNNPGGQHVLAIQVTQKDYTGGGYATQPTLAFHLVFQWSLKPPPPAINITKTVKSITSNPGLTKTSGGLPVAQPGDQVVYTVQVTAGGSVSKSDPLVYNKPTDPTPGCMSATTPMTFISGPSGGSPPYTITSPGTDTWQVSFTVGNGCADGTTITNTATVTSNGNPSPDSSSASVKLVIPYYPWISTNYGDVHSNSGINVNPASRASYIISAGGSINGMNSDACLVFYSSPGCNSNGGAYGTLPWPWQEDPSFYTKLDNPAQYLGTTAQALGSTKAGDITPGFYVFTGSNLTLAGLVVHGAVTIYASNPNAQVKIIGGIQAVGDAGIPALWVVAGHSTDPTNTGNSCNSSTKGEILIDHSVSQIRDTVLFTPGVICTSDTQTSTQLNMTGALIGGKIDLTNRIGSKPSSGSTPTNPAEQYSYIGNFILNPPIGMLNLNQSGSTIYLQGENVPQL